MHDAEEGTPFSPIRSLRFREGKGTERAIAHPRQSFACVAGLQPCCILLIGRLRGVSSFVLSSRQDTGRQAHHLLPGEMTVATPGFPLGSPSPSQVWAQGSPQLCSTFSCWRFFFLSAEQGCLGQGLKRLRHQCS